MRTITPPIPIESGAVVENPPARACWAVAGNPNAGKSTLFNRLTGLRQQIANYPGVTVEKREGVLRGDPAHHIRLLDLPGAYSLSARSPDEQIPRDVLLGRQPGTPRPSGVIVVVDAANLERNLYLTSQLLELGQRVVIACNMSDRADAAGVPVDADALSRELHVPVIPTAAHVGRGVDHVRQAVCSGDAPQPPARQWRLPPPMERIVSELARDLADAGLAPPESADGAALLWLTDGADPQSGGDASDSVPPDVRPLVDAALQELAADGFDDPAGAIVEARCEWIADVAGRVVRRRADAGRRVAMTDRIDRILAHRIWGLPIFAGIMLLMFWSIFFWAEPIMRGIEFGQGRLQGLVRAAMAAGPLRDLLADGVIGGVGAVLVFFPQICI
ncbi:MAG: ferrous iron transporter B, partial [Phycisphaerae bacterium]